MAEIQKEPYLFEDFDDYIRNPLRCTPIQHDRNYKVSVLRGCVNPFFLGDYDYEGPLYFPKAEAVNISLPEAFVSVQEAKSLDLHNLGIHNFVYDEKLNTTWTRPINFFKLCRQAQCVTSTDFSAFKDPEMNSFSIWNIARNRYETCAMQKYGIAAIPVFTFGNPSIEEYWFHGLPEHSQIAVGNIAIGRQGTDRDLREYAIRELVRQKRPTSLIVYGQPLWFEPGIDVKFYPGKLYEIKSKKVHNER